MKRAYIAHYRVHYILLGIFSLHNKESIISYVYDKPHRDTVYIYVYLTSSNFVY